MQIYKPEMKHLIISTRRPTNDAQWNLVVKPLYRTPWSGTVCRRRRQIGRGRPASVQWSFCNKSLSSDTAVTALRLPPMMLWSLRVAYIHSPLSVSFWHLPARLVAEISQRHSETAYSLIYWTRMEAWRTMTSYKPTVAAFGKEVCFGDMWWWQMLYRI